MQDTAASLLGLLVALLAAVVIGGMPFHYRRERKKARAQAEQQFRGYRSSGQDGSALLVGATAQILEKSDSYTSHNGRIHDYVLTLFALTPEGRHFLFKSNANGNPYVSLLSQERARLVLGDKYREAVAGDA